MKLLRYQDEEDTIYLAGTTSGLFATDLRQGENTIWERQAVNHIGNVPVTMIDSRAYDKNIVVATHGAGIFSTKVVQVSVKDQEQHAIAQLGFTYPNPSNGQIQLDVQLGRAAHMELKVFDMLGQYILSIVSMSSIDNVKFSDHVLGVKISFIVLAQTKYEILCL